MCTYVLIQLLSADINYGGVDYPIVKVCGKVKAGLGYPCEQHSTVQLQSG